MSQAWLGLAGALVFSASPATAFSQSVPDEMAGRARLELTMEIATTSDEGYPSALRVTIKNVGGETVSLPVFGAGCSPDNGTRVVVTWVSNDGSQARGGGGGCGTNDVGSLKDRVEKRWLRLRPGEFLTTTESLLNRYDPAERGTVRYSVEYEPPLARKGEIAELAAAGYVIPTELIRTDERTFQIR